MEVRCAGGLRAEARSDAERVVSEKVGVVVIGRNEGDRLVRCMESVRGAEWVVYVDSGSADGSVERALERGAEVVALDMTKPFTAARARNAGLARLLELDASVRHVQFVDGDCELQPGWLEAGAATLAAHPRVAAVCGRLREQYPKLTIWNRLCDLEWVGPVGEVQACGGVAMYRVDAINGVGRFRESMIAGEEPELCLRLRAVRFSIQRLDQEMALHDAAMMRFRQWWKRAVRSGHAYAESAHLHRQSPRKPWRREVMRNWLWGLIVPIVALSLAWPTYGISLALLVLYPVWMWRIARERRRRLADTTSDAWLYAFFCMLGKAPSALGQFVFWWRRLRGRRSALIEYKSPDPRPAQQGIG